MKNIFEIEIFNYFLFLHPLLIHKLLQKLHNIYGASRPFIAAVAISAALLNKSPKKNK